MTYIEKNHLLFVKWKSGRITIRAYDDIMKMERASTECDKNPNIVDSWYEVGTKLQKAR